MTNSLDKTSAKILVLGDSGVGKSSLIHLICHSATLSSAQWTIGCSMDVKLHNNSFLEFWDIGGSRGHKIARTFLYQDYHGIMLVFDATNKKSRVNLNEWLAEVTQKTNDKDLETYVSSNIPTITVGTKRDLLPFSSLLDIDDDSTSNHSEHCSVVDFTDSPRTTPEMNPLAYRRLNTSDYSTTSASSSYSPYASFQSSRQSPYGHHTNHQEPLLGSLSQSTIYVNTQDVLSFSEGSKNNHMLNNFFRCVIERINKKFYNKLTI